jgi:hypothetical protein
LVRPAPSYRSLVNPRALFIGEVTPKLPGLVNKVLVSILEPLFFQICASTVGLFRLLLQLPIGSRRQRVEVGFCQSKVGRFQPVF